MTRNNIRDRMNAIRMAYATTSVWTHEFGAGHVGVGMGRMMDRWVISLTPMVVAGEPGEEVQNADLSNMPTGSSLLLFEKEEYMLRAFRGLCSESNQFDPRLLRYEGPFKAGDVVQPRVTMGALVESVVYTVGRVSDDAEKIWLSDAPQEYVRKAYPRRAFELVQAAPLEEGDWVVVQLETYNKRAELGTLHRVASADGVVRLEGDPDETLFLPGHFRRV